MTAKEYLNQAFQLSRDIRATQEQIQHLRNKATAATGAYSSMPTGGTDEGKLDSTVAVYIDLERELEYMATAYAVKYREIAGLIERIQQPEYRELLKLRYLCMKKWEDIAEIMGYSFRNVTRLHGKALEKVKDVLECPIPPVV